MKKVNHNSYEIYKSCELRFRGEFESVNAKNQRICTEFNHSLAVLKKIKNDMNLDNELNSAISLICLLADYYSRHYDAPCILLDRALSLISKWYHPKWMYYNLTDVLKKRIDNSSDLRELFDGEDVNSYNCENHVQVCLSTLDYIMKMRYHLLKCENCDIYFIPFKNEEYCCEQCKIDGDKNKIEMIIAARQKAYAKSEIEKTGKNDVTQLKHLQFVHIEKDYNRKYMNGEITFDSYIRWLNEFLQK